MKVIGFILLVIILCITVLLKKYLIFVKLDFLVSTSIVLMLLILTFKKNFNSGFDQFIKSLDKLESDTLSGRYS